MELTWWVVAILGCVALAVCIAAALLQPVKSQRRPLRRLANVDRLTRLPEYRRAIYLRTLAAVVAFVLLMLAFGAAVLAAARPTGLPSAAQQFTDTQPEDIMLCMNGPAFDPAIGATLRYFADRVKTFSTQRIGLTSPDRRLVPMTRDYQYAAARFSEYAAAPEQSRAAVRWAPPVSYVDYAGGVEDVLAMCLTGFPSFDQKTAQRRSLIYVGPGSRRAPGETRPVLFSTDAVRDLAQAAGVQVNIVSMGATSSALDALARDTGGRSFPGDPGVAGRLAEVGRHPPRPTTTADDAAAAKPVETPDIPLRLALAALTGLLLWPVVVRR
jgi:hypothetical protein